MPRRSRDIPQFTTKMNRNITFTILAASLALGWWALDTRGKTLRKEQELAELRRAKEAAEAAAEKALSELSPLEDNITRLKKERDDAISNRTAATSAGAGKPNDANAVTPADIDFEKLGTPGARKATADVVNAMVSSKFREEYAPLLKRWNLSATELDAVLSHLPSLEMGLVDYMMTHPGAANLKPDELKAATAKLGQETRERLKSIVGTERLGELDNYNKEIKVNKVVGPYAKQLDITGFPMTSDQKAKLADAISSAREAHGATNSETGAIPTAALLKQEEDRQAHVVQKAAGFLSPDQINGLQTIFREENNQSEAAWKLNDELLKGTDAGGAK